MKVAQYLPGKKLSLAWEFKFNIDYNTVWLPHQKREAIDRDVKSYNYTRVL